MDFQTAFQALLGQSPALALAFFIWYMSNKDLLRLLQERREMLDAMRLDAKETQETLKQVAADYKAELRASSESKVAVQSEIHALRGKMTELILKVEAVLLRIANDKKGGND